MSSSQRINHKGYELGLKAIFTSIAGALILIFFIKFAYDQQAFQETVNTGTTLNDFNDYLDALSISSSTSKAITLPEETTIDYTCDTISINNYQKKDHKIIYAEPMTTKTINTWAKDWEYPYRITSFYYLDNNRRYLLIYNDASKNYVTNLNLPSIFNHQKQHINTFLPQRINQEQQGKPITLIFFTPNIPPGTQQLQNTNIIRVDTDNEEVIINNNRYPYYGEAMMLGAMTGPNTYECNQEAAITRLQEVTSIYRQKTQLLQLKTTDTCRNILNQAQQTLSTYETTSLQALSNLKQSLEEQNKELIKHDCPTIY